MTHPDLLPFNSAPSTVMHIDLNSCFATIEQQANPNLRGRPLVVAAYDSPGGCVVAPSIEAKRLGIKVGFRVRDARALCPDILVLPPDPDKYRHVHRELRKLLSHYSADFVAKSIDEFVVDFAAYPAFHQGLIPTGREIKNKIKERIGDWLTVSIGLGPNRFLAKQASNLKKPDGLEEINCQNYLDVYSRLTLTDLTGINTRYSARLSAGGIYTPLDFLTSDLSRLRSIFHSVNAYYWYLRLRGWEIDDVNFGRKSFGNMYSLPRHFSRPEELAPILHKLVEKTSFRLRSAGMQSRGIYLGILYTDHTFWHGRKMFAEPIFAAADIYRAFYRLLIKSPLRPVANLAITCFDLSPAHVIQLDLFNAVSRSLNLSQAMDKINTRYGHFVLSPAAMLGTSRNVPDRIGFGNTGDLTTP